MMRHLFIAMALAMTSLIVVAQDRGRVITPVKPETNVVKPPGKGIDEKTIQQYISGDTVSAAREARKDSLRRVYTHYPRLTGIDLYATWLDLLLMACGQDYGSVGVGVNINMWNRLLPTAELGFGRARSTLDDGKGTYRGKFSPYFKVGAQYNFLFKQKPDYRLGVGVIMGYSTFGYDVTDIDINDNYWQYHETLDITGERASALWAELTAGIKVKIAGHVSLGWSAHYHFMLHSPRSDRGKPWYIPGYGTRSSNLTATAAVYYTF